MGWIERFIRWVKPPGPVLTDEQYVEITASGLAITEEDGRVRD